MDDDFEIVIRPGCSQYLVYVEGRQICHWIDRTDALHGLQLDQLAGTLLQNGHLFSPEIGFGVLTRIHCRYIDVSVFHDAGLHQDRLESLGNEIEVGNQTVRAVDYVLVDDSDLYREEGHGFLRPYAFLKLV